MRELGWQLERKTGLKKGEAAGGSRNGDKRWGTDLSKVLEDRRG